MVDKTDYEDRLMEVIYKYNLEREFNEKQYLLLPRGAKPIRCAKQTGDICLWCLIDTTEAARMNELGVGEGREFILTATGWPELQESWNYIDTILEENNLFPTLVWHLFEVL